MRLQLALLLAVPLIGLGHGSPQPWSHRNHGSPQWSRQSWRSTGDGGQGYYPGGQAEGGQGYYPGGEGGPQWSRQSMRSSRTAPEWMNRQMGGYEDSMKKQMGDYEDSMKKQMGGYEDGMNRQMGGYSMSGPSYADYSRAGQKKYGGAQNYGVGDYGLDKIDNEDALEGESESLFFETTATRPVFSNVPLDEQCERKPGPTPNKGTVTADVKCEHKCMDEKCYVTAHVSCNCRSPFMDDPADQQEECLRGTVTGLHNATNIPEACHSLPDGACNDNDCENGKKEPKSREPLWKECRDEIDAWDDDDGLAKPEVNYYCHFSCQAHSERCWANTRTTCTRESNQRAVLQSTDSTTVRQRSSGWFTITEEEWRGPAFMQDGGTPNGDPKYPPECRGVAKKRCANVCDSTVSSTDPTGSTTEAPVSTTLTSTGFTVSSTDGDFVAHDGDDGGDDGTEPAKSEGALYGPGAPQVQTGTGGKQGKDYWFPKDVKYDFRRFRNRRRF